ncbi:MAG: molybdopterin-dependent oxidoreductase, partial [Dehalococcoidia bacterium]
HLVPVLNEAQKRGATLVVIDPRRTQLAAKADLHLAPRPGTDLPLAMAMLRYLFEEGFADWDFLQKHAHGAEELRRRALPWKLERAAEVTGVPAEDIARLARMYAEASPAAIRSGWGIERNRNGGSAVAAVLALPAVGGKFGVRGGGYTMSNSGAYAFDRIAAANEAPPPTRVLNMSLLGRLITEDMAPPIKVLFVYNCNPLATMPNQELVRAGLERPDLFTVVSEQFWTDTTRYADVVLPATSFLEHSEVTRGFGSMVIQHPRAVALPPGEARPNYEMFADLCRRLGVDRPGDPETPEELEEALLNHSEWQRKQLREDDIAFPDLGWAPVQFVDSLPLTPDSKIHLVPEALDAEAPLGIYGYQADPDNDSLALISPASNRTISSYLGNLQRETARLDIHPEDAASRGVSDGDEVRVSNALGEVRVRARVTSDVARGVVVLPKGLWSFQTLSGTTANALAPDTLTDLGQGPCFNDARVEVTRVEERQPPS